MALLCIWPRGSTQILVSGQSASSDRETRVKRTLVAVAAVFVLILCSICICVAFVLYLLCLTEWSGQPAFSDRETWERRTSYIAASIFVLKVQCIGAVFGQSASKRQVKDAGTSYWLEERKQGLEKQRRHHSAVVQTGGKWKYTKTDR